MLRSLTAALSLGLILAAGANGLQAGGDDDKTIQGIGPVGKITKLRSGFAFTEGPAADRQGNVYFSDIPNQKIYKINLKNEFYLVRDNTNHANGLAINAHREIVACEMEGRIVAITADGKALRVIANQYRDKRFNAPNDLVIDQTGGIYFTDPAFRAPKPLPQGKTRVYYITPERKVLAVIADLPNPNGIRLSPDQKTLYVVATGQREVMAYPVESPGKLGPKKEFCKLKEPSPGKGAGGDGAAVDAKGNLYVATMLGIQVFNPQGEPLGIIAVPEAPSNLTFGGADFKTLFITARTSVYSVRMEVPGIHNGDPRTAS
jgi:gluconolactonase